MQVACAVTMFLHFCLTTHALIETLTGFFLRPHQISRVIQIVLEANFVIHTFFKTSEALAVIALVVRLASACRSKVPVCILPLLLRESQLVLFPPLFVLSFRIAAILTLQHLQGKSVKRQLSPGT